MRWPERNPPQQEHGPKSKGGARRRLWLQRNPDVRSLTMAIVAGPSVFYGPLGPKRQEVWRLATAATAVVEPYNTVLCVHILLELTDVTIMMDDEALYGAAVLYYFYPAPAT